MAKLTETAKKQEKVVLVGVINQHQRAEQAEEYLDELSFLAYTAGGRVVKRFLQRLPYPNPRTFIG
ncbi:MAG: GTPase HflX, partial [Bacteroidota bacterium]